MKSSGTRPLYAPIWGSETQAPPKEPAAALPPSSTLGLLAQRIFFRLLPSEAHPGTWFPEGFWVSFQRLLPQILPPSSPFRPPIIPKTLELLFSLPGCRGRSAHCPGRHHHTSGKWLRLVFCSQTLQPGPPPSPDSIPFLEGLPLYLQLLVLSLLLL